MKEYRLGLLGNPVAHSRSPILHAAMLDLAGLAGTYEKIEADERRFVETVDGLRAGRWDGLNVTMPFKGIAAETADTLSPEAAKAGSVNTLSLSKGVVHGHSTDISAFASLLAAPQFADLTDVLLLGAGGSAAAALVALSATTRRVRVAARRSEQAEEIAGRLGGEAIAWETPVPGALVINTTPIGMKGEWLPEPVMAVAGGVIDLPYGDTTTPAIDHASKVAIPAVDGHEFLLRQAMDSFEIWTGIEIDFDALEGRLRNT